MHTYIYAYIVEATRIYVRPFAVLYFFLLPSLF